MTAYYNENDPYAAGWLRNLVAAGHLPAGTVDDRSILEVEPGDLAGYDQVHWFAGIGGWPYALQLAGWTGPAWTGSCPCQPLSSAGQRRGHLDERHLWPAFQQLIALCRPATVFGEQVASKDGREWLSGIRADLEHLGYAVGAADLPAAGVGAPHIRQRLFWVADARVERRQQIGRGAPHDEGAHGRQPNGHHLASGNGATGGLADAADARRDDTRQHDGRSPPLPARPVERGAAGGLADAEHAIGRAQHLAGNDVLDRRDAGWQEAHRQPGACGEVRGLADADGGQSRHGGLQPGGQHGQQPQDGRAGQRLADAQDLGGRRGRRCDAETGDAGQWPSGSGGIASGLGVAETTRHRTAERSASTSTIRLVSELSGYWSDAVWLPCLDGKARRTLAAVQPLVDARGCICGLRLGEDCTCAEKPSRVGMLRGAGNAISPPLAAAFVRAFMECRNEQ